MQSLIVNSLSWYVQLKFTGNAPTLIEPHSHLLFSLRSWPNWRGERWGYMVSWPCWSREGGEGLWPRSSPWQYAGWHLLLSALIFVHLGTGTQCCSMELVNLCLFFWLGSVSRKHGPFCSRWLGLFSAFIVSRTWVNALPSVQPLA